MQIKLKRGNQANLPVLDNGEPGFTQDTKKLYIGTPSGNIIINPEANTILTDEITGCKYTLTVIDGELFLRVLEV